MGAGGQGREAVVYCKMFKSCQEKNYVSVHVY